MTETLTRTGFHCLTVVPVKPHTDDVAAVTFDVPPELADALGFAAGRSLTLSRLIDGVVHRRTYSICSAVGERARIGRGREDVSVGVLGAHPAGCGGSLACRTWELVWPL